MLPFCQELLRPSTTATVLCSLPAWDSGTQTPIFFLTVTDEPDMKIMILAATATAAGRPPFTSRSRPRRRDRRQPLSALSTKKSSADLADASARSRAASQRSGKRLRKRSESDRRPARWEFLSRSWRSQPSDRPLRRAALGALSMIDREHAYFTQHNNVMGNLNCSTDEGARAGRPPREARHDGEYARRTSTSKRATSMSSTTAQGPSPYQEPRASTTLEGPRLDQHPLACRIWGYAHRPDQGSSTHGHAADPGPR